MTLLAMLPLCTVFTGVSLALALAGAAPAAAQTVWRCTGAGGVAYSDRPCPAGRALTVADERSPEQVQAAQAVAARERRLADQLTAERRVREAPPPVALRPPRGRARTVPAPSPALSPAPDRRHPTKRRQAAPQPEDARTWRAIAPATPRK